MVCHGLIKRLDLVTFRVFRRARPEPRTFFDRAARRVRCIVALASQHPTEQMGHYVGVVQYFFVLVLALGPHLRGLCVHGQRCKMH